MTKKKYSRKKRVGKRRRWTRKKRGGGVTKRVVRRMISRNIEKKTIQQFVNAVSFYYPAQGSTYDAANTLLLGAQAGALVVQQGVTQAARIGNRIKVTKLEFKGTLYPATYSGIFNPNPELVQVKLVLFYDKLNPTAVPAPRTNFFQAGAGTSPIVGNLNDLWIPINTDQYRVLATKSFKLGFAQYGGSGYQAAPQAFSNNEFKLNCNVRWNITKYHLRMLRYNDNSAVPAGRHLYMQVMVSPTLGTTGSSGVIPCLMSYMQTMWYQDA